MKINSKDKEKVMKIFFNDGLKTSKRQLFNTAFGIITCLAIISILSIFVKPVFAESVKRGGTLVASMTGTPEFVDPHTAISIEDVTLTRAIYDSLVYTDHTLTPQPELAEKWDSSDATVWTFYLRKGVLFHHGREMDADDVVWRYNRILDPKIASPARKTFSMIESVKKIDKYTVQITLNRPFSEFPNLIGGVFQGRIGPRDVTDLNKKPIGTGPFKLVEFVPGEHATLARNENYWKNGQPYLDKVRFVYFPEMTSHISGISRGKIDVVWSPSADVLPVLKSNKDITVRSIATSAYQPFIMRTDVAPFNDKRVRQAFKYIVDREAMNDIVNGGYGIVGNDHPVPPSSAMYMKQTPRSQNIEKAKALLSEAGFKDGMDIELLTWTGRAGLVDAGLAFQDMASKANVRVKIKTATQDQFFTKYFLKHNFYVSNWNSRTTLYELFSFPYYSEAKWNETHWKNKEFDDLLHTIGSETDKEKQKELWAKVQELFISEGPIIVAYHKPFIVAHRKNVKGYQLHPTALLDFRTTWLD